MGTKYLLAVLVAIAVLVVNQVFIQYFLYEKKYDAKTINVAGKQRMLSQKINLLFYQAQTDEQLITQLRPLIAEWENAHYNLLQDTEQVALSPVTHAGARELLTGLSEQIHFIKQQVAKLLADQQVDIAAINTSQAAFLVDMNKVVSTLEESSSNKLQFIVGIEIILMLFSLLIIILEVLYIFKPGYQALTQALAEAKSSKVALQKSLVELQHKNRDLEQFAYAASHDLQEPLRTIISFTQLLRDRYAPHFGDDGKHKMSLIIGATRRMRALINGLLAYTTIGRERLKREVDCNDLINQVKVDLDSLFAEKNAALTVGKLPKIMAYETELRLLFQNLIANALKFQQADNPPSIAVAGKKLDTHYQFSVQDNGIGISEEYQEQIFSMFKRLHTTDKYQGTGIGLAQCRKIVELHEGEIWVDSKEQEGSTFYFTIPYSSS